MMGDTPMMRSAQPPVLVLSPHARFGRRVSIAFALLFLFGFNVALVLIALTNWSAPCDAPLNAFLVAFGLVGVAGSGLYFILEVLTPDPLPPGLPSGPPPLARSRHAKHAVLALLFLALGLGAWGTTSFALAPEECAASAPVLYKWAFAASLAFCIFVALVVLVPLMSALMPIFALAIAPVIGLLAACAGWMHEAGRRGAFGTTNALQRALSGDDADAPVIAPVSNFALYVNTTALCWFMLYFLFEAHRSWDQPCAQPLRTFVGVTAAAGLTFTLLDFMRDVFQDPMPPMTKVEQAKARDRRRRRLTLYAWLLAGVLVWGGLGLLWVRASESCAVSAPAIYRLAMLICVAYVAFCALLGLVLLILAIDFCCSGRLRMVIVFER